MSMDKLLVVEDEVMTSELLQQYFEIIGYGIIRAQTGREAIKLAVEHQPKLIILDIILPDMDGYQVCKKLRGDPRTDHIPIIFLTQRDDRRDRLDGLELGADDYITKPFDVEELRLRVHNIIDQMSDASQVDPRSGLPNLELVKERLPELLEDPENFFLDVQIEHFEAYRRQYGTLASDQAILSAAKLISDVVREIEPARSFIGHPSDDHFLLAIPRRVVDRIGRQLGARFEQQSAWFYDYSDQRRGMMWTEDGFVPFMTFRMRRVRAEALRAFVSRGTSSPAASDPQQPVRRGLKEKALTIARPLLGGRASGKPALPPPDWTSHSGESDF